MVLRVITSYAINIDLTKFVYLGSSYDDFNNSAVFFFNKITLGYLYYQFITAVRKDTRK